MKALIFLSALMCACAHNVVTEFPSSAASHTGEVELALTTAANNVTVSISGNIVVRKAHAKNVLIRGVPAGEHSLHIAMGGGGNNAIEKAVQIEVAPGARTSVPVAAPTPTISSAIATGAVYIGECILLGAMLLAVGR